MLDVPRDANSVVYARKAAERATYAEHLASVRAASWRVGAVGWCWRVARGDEHGWVTLPGELEHFPAEDLAQHRLRLGPWLRGMLGVESFWLTLDYEAEAAGRLVFVVEVTG